MTHNPFGTECMLCSTQLQESIDNAPLHEWTSPDGKHWASFYRTSSGYLLRFPGLADFMVSADGHKVSVSPVPGVTQQTIEHLYLNQVLPLALSRQGKFVLHASAVEIAEFAVAFIGVSGRGKSTLAASFATSGFRFLTDDGLQLEEAEGGYLIHPSHPSIRLWEDSRGAVMPETAQLSPPVDYTPKARLLADEEVAYCDEPRPLKAMYFLGEGNTGKVTIEAVSGRDAMVELAKNCFLIDIEARDLLTSLFGQLSELVKRPMFFRLDYPRDYDLLPKVREAVIAHAGEQNAVEA